MLTLVGRRIAITVPLVVIVSFLVFLMIDFVPGDPALRLAGDDPTPDRVEAIREQLHLSDPLVTRYLDWLGGLITGDFGRSFTTEQPVGELLWDRLGVTVSLVVVSVVLMVLLGMALGIAASVRPGGIADRAVTTVCSVLVAVPSFWLALLLVVFFAVDRPIFPAIGYSPIGDGVDLWLYHLVLPAVALAATPAAELALQLRASLADVVRRDFVMAASARGMPRTQVIGKHALKNAAVPAVTVLGFRLAEMVGGAVVIETVFTLPGLGPLTVDSVLSGDVPVLLGVVVLSVVWVALFNLLTDLSYLYLNPKVRT
ncbi:ABC transporter permease [Pseudonocardia sp. NPDC049154]|uniref:ABC transporter permease n=1 Tax=Pseudonocardia sp. NPDC049154 TaxID=3155501 RepID=UPI0033F11F64